MFDIGFSEIIVIAVVALIVLGPEKLPKTARTLGHLFGRLQRYVADVKADINREMAARGAEEAAGRKCRSAATEIEIVDDARGAAKSRPNVRAVEASLNAAAAGSDRRRRRWRRAGAPATPAAPDAAADAPPAPRPRAATPPTRRQSLPGFDRG